jgi:hypothetical protein
VSVSALRAATTPTHPGPFAWSRPCPLRVHEATPCALRPPPARRPGRRMSARSRTSLRAACGAPRLVFPCTLFGGLCSNTFTGSALRPIPASRFGPGMVLIRQLSSQESPMTSLFLPAFAASKPLSAGRIGRSLLLFPVLNREPRRRSALACGAPRPVPSPSGRLGSRPWRSPTYVTYASRPLKC